MPDKPKLTDWDALEKQTQTEREAASIAASPEKLGEKDLNAAGAGGAAGAAGLGFIDKMSLGALPYIHDKLVDWAGEERMGKKYSELMPQAEAAHPVASTIGGGAGMALPIGGALRMAQGLRAIPFAGRALQGAAAVGGENVADQAVRTQTEDRPFNTTEAVGSGIIGAVDPFKIATKGVMALKPGMSALLGPILGLARKEVPAAAAGAEKTLGLNIGELGPGVTPPKRTGLGTIERPRAGPPEPQAPAPENLGAYAPDDPLGEIARMAKEQARLRRISDPNWAPDPGPLGPPRVLKSTRLPDPPPAAPTPPPPGLLERLAPLSDAYVAGTRGVTESGVRVGSEDKKKSRDRMRAIRR